MVESRADSLRIIRTKFCPPNLTSDLVSRDRLTDLLDGSQEVPLTLISAPAGYGKSVLVSQWLDQYDGLSFWLSVDEDDGNLRQFMAHLVTNLQSQFPDQFKDIWELLLSKEQVPTSVLSARLLNGMFDLTRPCTIVLDDYHCLKNDSAVHDLLEAIMQHPPPTVHFILNTRRDPALRLIRYRAANQLLEVRENDLRFNNIETSRLICNVTGKTPSEKALLNLEKQLEGWAVGLRLTAVALKGTENPDAFINSLRGGTPYTQEYLLSEVISRLDPGTRNVLLKSSLLDRFCEELVAHVCMQKISEEEPPGSDARKFIELIEQRNLFAIRLDRQRRWYRFHHLFQQMLQTELSRVTDADTIAAFHLEASRWFESRDDLDEAIKHALRAGDEKYAARIIERHYHAAMEQDRWFAASGWIEQLPEEFVEGRPQLLLAKAWIAYAHLNLDRVNELVQMIPPLLEEQWDRDELWGELDYFRGLPNLWGGNFQESVRLLSRAQEMIPKSRSMLHSEVDLSLTLALYLTGKQDDASRMIDRQIRLHGPRQLSRRVGAIAFIRLMGGDLDALNMSAIRMQSMDVAMRTPLVDLWSHYFMGLAALHNLRLETAIDCFELALEEPHLHDRRAAIDSYAGLALTQQLQGQPEQALSTIDRLAALVHELDKPDEFAILYSCKTRIGLLQGANPSELTSLYRAQEAVGILDFFIWMEVPALSRVRRLLAEASEDSLSAAQALIDEVRSLCQSACLTCQLIEIEVLQTLLDQRMGREEAALESLGKSLALARQGGWIRPYVEAGEPMANLLDRYRANTDDDFVSRVLSSCRESVAAIRVSAPGHALADPPGRPDTTGGICDLTHRELDILELLAQRLQNKEIASQLFISTHTVKDHLKHIYQKLGVNNRRLAVLRAVEANLIEPK